MDPLLAELLNTKQTSVLADSGSIGLRVEATALLSDTLTVKEEGGDGEERKSFKTVSEDVGDGDQVSKEREAVRSAHSSRSKRSRPPTGNSTTLYRQPSTVMVTELT
jgi:hypothetical protein